MNSNNSLFPDLTRYPPLTHNSKVNWDNFKSKFNSRNSVVQKVRTEVSLKNL